jgi:D-hexose-6-phosphate mutarotase
MAITSKNIKVATNENGLQIFQVTTANSTCEFSNYGAHIISFSSNGDELLWVSEKSYFQAGKAIRGGIPVCWPYFGKSSDDTAPAHGYARLSEWEILEISDTSNNEVFVHMRLDCSKLPACYKNLELQIEFIIGKTLKINLTTTNMGSQEFILSQALHSYFAVNDISKVQIAGLEDTNYFDALSGKICHQTGLIAIKEEVDRVYLDTETSCTIIETGKPYQVMINKSGSTSTVVWNPWIDKSIRMADFGDDEYLNMLCVETVNAKDDCRVLTPSQSHTLSLEIMKK